MNFLLSLACATALRRSSLIKIQPFFTLSKPFRIPLTPIRKMSALTAEEVQAALQEPDPTTNVS